MKALMKSLLIIALMTLFLVSCLLLSEINDPEMSHKSGKSDIYLVMESISGQHQASQKNFSRN